MIKLYFKKLNVKIDLQLICKRPFGWGILFKGEFKMNRFMNL